MKRTKFNLSNYRLFTGDMGRLYPIGLWEVLPGDTFQAHTNLLVRLSPMSAPVMHGMSVRVHHWFVPHRIVWEGWEDFITGGKDGNTDTPPQIMTTGAEKDLFDYFGVTQTAGISVSELPIRGFNFIYNTFYRDQDLVPERAANDLTIPNIAWEKDYFTSARPWAQKGDQVTMPIGDTAPIIGTSQLEVTNMDGGLRGGVVGGQVSGTNVLGTAQNFGGSGIKVVSGLEADLSAATGVSIDEIRRAFAIQRFQEARSRYGSRYSEYLRYLGVNPKDLRLDEPEYLGGGTGQVSVSEVLQTAPEAGTEDPTAFGVGDLYGHGIAALRSNAYRRFFEEHGYVISVCSVRPKAIYMNGVERTWLRREKEDFWQKELEFIGQQPILKNEVFADPVVGDQTWGFQDRYREYRECPSKVVAEFRNVLDYWHLARKFATGPALNAAFVQCDPSKRIFNEQTYDSLWCMAQHKVIARRPVSGSAAARVI